MSARSQLQSKPVADLREIADGLGLEHKGLQKAKLIDLLLEQGDAIGDIADGSEEEVAVVASDNDMPSVCLLYTSPSPRDISGSRMPSSA